MPTGRPTPAGPDAVRSAVGPSEQFGYGVLDVQVAATGSRITDVSVPLLQTAELTSEQISTEAIAMLRAEALSAQGGRIDAISGATYTSEAYIQSLQAAIESCTDDTGKRLRAKHFILALFAFPTPAASGILHISFINELLHVVVISATYCP